MAAAFVVAGHLPLAVRHSQFVHEGFMGVTFFFVLSGFILTFSYTNRIQQGSTRYLSFLASRIARIYPLHIVTMVAALPLAIVAGWPANSLALQAAAQLTLVQAYVPDKSIYFSFNAPSWSLSVEMFFYALFPVLVIARTRWLMLLAAMGLAFHFGRPWSDTQFSLYVFPPARLIDFVLGILLHRLVFARFQPSDWLASLLQWASVALFTLMFAVRDVFPIDFRYDIYYLVPTGLLITSFAWQGGQLAKASSGKRMVALGEWSFALYLVHQLVIRYGEIIRSRTDGGEGLAPEFLFSIGYVLVAIWLSKLLHENFELLAKSVVLNMFRKRQAFPSLET